MLHIRNINPEQYAKKAAILLASKRNSHVGVEQCNDNCGVYYMLDENGVRFASVSAQNKL